MFYYKKNSRQYACKQVLKVRTTLCSTLIKMRHICQLYKIINYILQCCNIKYNRYKWGGCLTSPIHHPAGGRPNPHKFICHRNFNFCNYNLATLLNCSSSFAPKPLLVECCQGKLYILTFSILKIYP